MQYFLTPDELQKFEAGLRTVIAVPFIDDIEDYIVEAIWEHAKDIEGIDPFYNIRSKKLYDVVDNKTHTGWSVKSLQWAFRPNCEFELVIQRADVYKKAQDLGFEPLSSDSDPNRIGAALLKHWSLKVEQDAIDQNVTSKRVMILLKTENKQHFAVFEEDLQQYSPEELNWRWTNERKNGLQAIRESDGMCVYRWYPSQKQFFERFILPPETQMIDLDNPVRLRKAEVVDILLPYLQGHQ
jgi:hypothetical protein